MRTIPGRTDFGRFNHRQLQAMLYAGKVPSLRAVAQWWDAVGAGLHGQAGNLERQLDGFQHKWRGGAAGRYQVMITDLGAGLRRLADTAYAMRNLANDEADALSAAQAAMPAPVDIPDVPAATVRLATTPLDPHPAASPDEVARMRRAQTDATAAVRAQQQLTRASNAAHAEAIRVLNQLAERYVLAYESTPVTPNGRLTAAGDGPNPLFGNMFTAGLAAASAAAAGRFGPLP
ncbi:PPE domain-containing protein, partial [Actinophytocola sp.]|uniref:PPE domain-containing protein n=1 Tax=Actinophytocola sp. TaxID=1872138 RepID=UPI002D7E1C35